MKFSIKNFLDKLDIVCIEVSDVELLNIKQSGFTSDSFSVSTVSGIQPRIRHVDFKMTHDKIKKITKYYIFLKKGQYSEKMLISDMDMLNRLFDHSEKDIFSEEIENFKLLFK